MMAAMPGRFAPGSRTVTNAPPWRRASWWRAASSSGRRPGERPEQGGCDDASGDHRSEAGSEPSEQSARAADQRAQAGGGGGLAFDGVVILAARVATDQADIRAGHPGVFERGDDASRLVPALIDSRDGAHARRTREAAFGSGNACLARGRAYLGQRSG